MVADLSFFGYFAPVAAFLIVFAVVFAVLFKLKILGENKWGMLLISFLVASVFISAAGLRDYVLTVTPWFAVLLISLVFILMLVGFIGKDADFMKKGIGIGVLIAALIIFLASGYVVFSSVISPYLPGPTFGLGDVDAPSLFLLDWVYSPRVVGGIVLLVSAALASWALMKSSK